MSDIYKLLAKHFLNETSQEEEILIEKFKKNQKKEYNLLLMLWSNGNVSVKDFDSNLALKKIKQQKNTLAPIKKLIPRRTIIKFASIAAIFMIGIFTFYYTNFYNPTILKLNNTNSIMEISLNDGSTVWLNSNSSLEYTKRFDENNRGVQLKGEAFFEVTKNPEKPFIVSTNNSNTTVLGTSFNVISEKENTTVSVATGKVQVANKNGSSQVVILPGFSANVKESEVISSEIKNQNYLSWKTNILEFENNTLEEVRVALEKHFNISIIIQNEDSNCQFTGKFNNANMDEILAVMSYTFSLDYKIEEKNYILTLKNCK